MADALQGIRVLDFTQLVQGSLASQMLGDLGADVVKVERIGGEWMRHWSVYDHYLDGEGVAFLAFNRNKRSVCLDLKDPEAKALLHRMAARSDVVMENFRPGVMDRLGYGYEALRTLNPGLVYASATGFGPDGPYQSRPGQDLLMQGLAGLLALTGKADDPPTACGVGIGDIFGASQLAYGVLAALVHKQRTGEGQKVEGNLLDGLLALQLQELVHFLNGGAQPQRPRTNVGHTGAGSPFGIYRTKDGWLTLAMMPLPKLAAIVGEPWLAQFDTDAKGLRDRDAIKERLDPLFLTRTTKEWLALLDAHDVWCAPVQGYAEVEKDPQVVHNRTIQDCGRPGGKRFRTVRSPVGMSRTPPGIRRGVPAAGEHTEEVLRELGCTDADLARLRARNAIA